MAYSAIIIGLGRAGGRFLRAIQYLDNQDATIRLLAVVDSNRTRLESIAGTEVKTFLCYREALRSGTYDLIINCLSEREHYALFRFILDAGVCFRRILSEKPLTANLAEALFVANQFQETDISLNFVERYSPLVTEVRRYLERSRLLVRRANFFWGKYRIHDCRPTIGIESEISHPIDLVLWLSGVPSNMAYDIYVGTAITSNFSPHTDTALDTVSVTLSFQDRLLVTGVSSFVWGRRDRRVELFLSDALGSIQQLITMEFDSPLWDLDHIACFDLTATNGRPVELWSRTVGRQDVPKAIFSISKIVQFVRSNIVSLDGGDVDDVLAYIRQSSYVQAILHDISSAVANRAVHTSAFRRNNEGPGQFQREGRLAAFVREESSGLGHEWEVED